MISGDSVLSQFGLLGILIVIFMETGLLIGFIFPGDTLLFTAGIASHAANPFTPLWTLLLGIPLAAIAGDQLGYFIGKKVGPKILKSQVMGWIGEEAIEKTHRYFDRYGPVTVLLARFVAVVRTVTPVLAGLSGMDHKKYTLYSVLGSFLWGGGITLLGYSLGQIPLVEKYMHWFIAIGIGAVVVPMLVKTSLLVYRSRKAAAESGDTTTTAAASSSAAAAEVSIPTANATAADSLES